MRLLLDTHAFLWFIAGDLQLDEQTQDLIVAQAIHEDMSVITRDQALKAYDLRVERIS